MTALELLQYAGLALLAASFVPAIRSRYAGAGRHHGAAQDRHARVWFALAAGAGCSVLVAVDLLAGAWVLACVFAAGLAIFAALAVQETRTP